MSTVLPALTPGQTITLDKSLVFVLPIGHQVELPMRLHRDHSGVYSLATDVDIAREQITESRDHLGFHSDDEVLQAMRARAAEHGLVIEPTHTNCGDDFSVTITQDIDHPATITAAYKQFLRESALLALDNGNSTIPAPFLDQA